MLRKRAPFNKNSQGFTLIELMIAMAVLVLVLVGYLCANTTIQQSNEAAFERTLALQDANQVLERMRMESASGIFPGNVTAEFPDGEPVSGFTSLSSQSVTVDYVDSTADPLDVTVTVNWLERGVRSTSVSIRSRLTQGGGS